ncbi:MAG: putative capsid protein [Circoviridae sp.]|nr:MAG: putative capsid protein [Circoviridae sp.]
MPRVPKKTVTRRRKARITRNPQRPPKMATSRDLMPNVFKTSLHYRETILLSSSTLLPTAFNNFSMNSLFDPNRTGTGHQPYGFDQLAAFYGRYYVTGAKMICTFSCQTKDTDSTVTGPILCGVTGRAESTFATQNADNWAEYPNADTVLLSTDETSRQLTSYYTPSLLGWTKQDRANIANLTSNPPREWLAAPWIFNTGQTAATDTICHVHIEFDCEFSYPVALPIS